MKSWRARLPAYIHLPIVSTEGNDCNVNTNVAAFLATVSNSWRDGAGSYIMKEGHLGLQRPASASSPSIASRVHGINVGQRTARTQGHH